MKGNNSNILINGDYMSTAMRESLYGYEVRVPDKRRRETKSYNLQGLWQRSHEILALALQGYKQSEIAKFLQITPTTVSNTINSELGQEKLAAMREGRDAAFVAVSEEVLRLTDKAMKVYDEIFDSDTISYELKKKTADTIVQDIAGIKAPVKTENRHMNLHATPAELAEFKVRGMQAARDAGFLIESTPEAEVVEKIT